MKTTHNRSRAFKQSTNTTVARQPAIPFTRFSSLLPFISFFNNIGAPTDRFLRAAKISVSYKDSPNKHIPLHSAYLFAEHAARSEGINNLGLTVGQNTSLADLGPYGYLIQQSSTIYEYLQKGIRLIDSETSGQRFWLSEYDGELRFNSYISGSSDYGRSQADMYALIITINTLRKMVGDQWSPRELYLANIHSEKLADIPALADTNITVGGKYSSFTLPRSMLKQAFHPAINHETSTDSIKQRLLSPLPVDFIIAISQIVEMLLLQGHSKVDLAAEAAGMTVRTLQRRLTEVGMSYTQLVNSTRVDIAARWLKSSDMSISAIASTLGYSDASNFTRAFRRQTGISPQGFREANTVH